MLIIRRSRLSCYDYWIFGTVSIVLNAQLNRFKGINHLQYLPICSRGLRSKSVKRIEHHLAMNIKETQAKIWNGVTKDVGYIRKILNEVYFLKFKVCYKKHL